MGGLSKMFKTREISIGPIFRFLIGSLGSVVVVTRVVLAMRAAFHPLVPASKQIIVTDASTVHHE